MRLITKNKTATSNGCLSKAWYKSNNHYYLVKGNSNGIRGFGYEPISEAIAYKVAHILGIDSTPTKVMRNRQFKTFVKTYGIDLVSISKGIENIPGEQKLSAIKLMEFVYNKSISTNYWGLYTAIKFNDIDKFIKMLIFDAIIGNEDRHLNNWEVGVSSKGFRHTTLFDNGASLLALVPDRDLKLNFKLGRDKSKPFKDTHNRQVELIRRKYPKFKWVLDINEVWYNIERYIEPELKLLYSINPKRCECVRHYLRNRLYYYLSLFGGVYK